MLKKWIAIMVIALMPLFAFAGCGDSDSAVEPEDQAMTETTEEQATEETTKAQGDESEFIQRIAGLWLNGCQDAAMAKESAKAVGCTDVSMTEFRIIDGICYMSTFGDIRGEYDGDTVPDVTTTPIMFSYISPDYSKAKGKVGKYKIEFDMGSPNDQVIFYSCAGYYTHCAYNGFESFKAMNEYLLGN